MKIKNVLWVILLLTVVNSIPHLSLAQTNRRTYNTSSRNTYSTPVPSRRVNNYASSMPSYSNGSSSILRPDPGGNPDVPIDGGISILLAAGAAFGAKKIHRARRMNKTIENKQP